MNDVTRAAQALRAGELVAFPTETVYGLGADARNPTALAKIFAAKGRPADHPLIVHLPDAAHLAQWAIDIPASAHALAAAFWPGPLTLILKRHPAVPELVTGGQDTVGLRVPNHPVALALLREFGGEFGNGIAAPSANKFGRISPTTAAHVQEELGDAVTMILDGGACAVGIESTIVDMTSATPRILRPGAISADTLRQQLNAPVDDSVTAHPTGETKNMPRVSGSLAAHYAPRTPLRLCPVESLPAAVNMALQQGKRVAVLAPAVASSLPANQHIIRRIASADFSRFAHDLYATLRELDAAGCDLILVAVPPNDEAWRAVSDRLRRAAAGSGNE
ncbi:MAG: L-threonylcarbamoyladenylate synthase [Rugosibacter sp.]